jgi:hypothetical protein
MTGDNVSMLAAHLDPSTLQTDPFYFGRPNGARIDLISADPRLEVMFGAEGMLTMNGSLSDEGPFDAFLAMKIDGNFVTAAFHKGMDKDDFFQELVRCMPPGYQAQTPEGSTSEILIVDIFRTPSRGGSPEVGFTCTDPSQSVRWAGKNKFIIEGRAARSLSVRSELEIEVEGRRIKVVLGSGDHPLATAARIRQVLPLGYTAMIELPLFPGAEVVVTILRRHS